MDEHSPSRNDAPDETDAAMTDLLRRFARDDWAVVVPAPGVGPGNWAGAASATYSDGAYWLTYRERRPLTEGRGVAVVVARSEDGIRFTEVARVERDTFGADSFEKPCLVRLDDGWRLYLSCATAASKHWWVDSLTAAEVRDLPRGQRAVIHPGDETVGVKDPAVIRRTSNAGGPAGHWGTNEGEGSGISEVGASGAFEMWLTCHPLTEPGHEDRMTTRYLTSEDGLSWTDRGEVLAGRPGEWDARGARITDIVELPNGARVAFYDGRPDAEANWYEQTGAVVVEGGPQGRPQAAGVRMGPVGSPHSDGALRYVTHAGATGRLDETTRWYAERARPDGAHDLVIAVDGDVPGGVPTGADERGVRLTAAHERA